MRRKKTTTGEESWALLHTDFLKQAPKIMDGFAELIIADSPYNYGQAYTSYFDSLPHREFMSWVRRCLRECCRLLAAHGSIFIFAPDEWVSEVDVFCRQTLMLFRRSWIVWYYTFGVCNQKNFSRSHTHILYYSKAQTKFTFNDQAVRVPSARQLVYNDRRQHPRGKQPDNTWILLRDQLEPVMTPDQDTWLESRICGTFKERGKESPNQIPLAVMERIVLACSKVGDMVLDPFCGTGSSGVASVYHGRRYLGIDISSTCIKESTKRLLTAAAGAIPESMRAKA
jgi:site-specific DNA-methyltransferase (adenine-specific)